MNVCLVCTISKVEPKKAQNGKVSKWKKAEAKPENRIRTKASSGLSCKISTIPCTRTHMSLVHRFRHLRIDEATEFRTTVRSLAWYARTYASLRFHVHHFRGLTQLILGAVLFALRFFLFFGRTVAKWCCVYTSSFVFLLPMLIMCFYPRFTFFYSHCLLPDL